MATDEPVWAPRPGSMVTDVAPVTVQERVAVSPAWMVAGVDLNSPIDGAGVDLPDTTAVGGDAQRGAVGRDGDVSDAHQRQAGAVAREGRAAVGGAIQADFGANVDGLRVAGVDLDDLDRHQAGMPFPITV